MHRLIHLAAASFFVFPAVAHSTSPDPPERSADARDKIICKKFIKTGSLVDGYRTCKPKWEWERERANIRHSAAISDSCRARAEGGSGCF